MQVYEYNNNNNMYIVYLGAVFVLFYIIISHKPYSVLISFPLRYLDNITVIDIIRCARVEIHIFTVVTLHYKSYYRYRRGTPS